MIVYNLIMRVIRLLLPIASIFGDKARMWADGRKNLQERTETLLKDNESEIIWFHCASLGEFEQGRQLIEDMRIDYPTYKIMVTFYSPSGYEPRKNYKGADYILYLPLDTPAAARNFVRTVKPKIVIFVKYEFWTNILRECKLTGAKLYVVSAIFNSKQMFFKWWGKQGVMTLQLFDRIFVQNQESKDLLATIGITKVTVAGDTRFDRVYSLATGAKAVEQMEHFAQSGIPMFVAGSTWPADDTIILDIISKYTNMKFVIVPHELPRQKIESLVKQCTIIGRKVVCYTDNCEPKIINEADVMIIDTIGILSSTYRYATFAYIGGGFGVGIHNILEAATYGLPIAFGPNYARFAEANDLIESKSARSINNSNELSSWVDDLLTNNKLRLEYGQTNKCYVANNIGATKAIRKHIANDIKIGL